MTRTNLEYLRSLDSIELGDDLQEVLDCHFNFARYGSEACEDCPLRECCEDYESPEEWLDAERKE